ncbi:MAG: hypothetical protein ABI619_12020 [Betaproteobacteria bacterium]
MVQTVALLFLVGLIPYTLYAGYWLYRAVHPLTGGGVGPVVYPAARVIACLLLLYALWRLRQAGARWRQFKAPGT